MRAKRLSAAQFVAAFELAMHPGPTNYMDKRTVRKLLDESLIEWCDTKPRYEVYRATAEGLKRVREHLEWLKKREEDELMYRTPYEQNYQSYADHHLGVLDRATAMKRPKTSRDYLEELRKGHNDE